MEIATLNKSMGLWAICIEKRDKDGTIYTVDMLPDGTFERGLEDFVYEFKSYREILSVLSKSHKFYKTRHKTILKVKER